MNGNFYYNQMIVKQRIQEQMREAEAHRLAAQAKPAADGDQAPKHRRGWLGRWLEAIRLTLSPRKTKALH